MSEKGRTASKNENLLFYSVTTLVILIAFLLFVPKVASSLFPFKRQMLWNDFISHVQKDKKIDPQSYWEFREFYSPGYFTVDKEANFEQVTNALKSYGITGNKTFSTLLVFHAKDTQSIDTLTSSSDFKALTASLHANNILFQNTTSLIYKLDDHHVIITFLAPLSEMKKANGFFDYNEKDKELLKGKLWFNITKITLH